MVIKFAKSEKMKKMKFKIICLIGGLIFLFAANSCKDNFLVEEPTTFVSSTNLYKTSADAQMVLTGLYDALQAGRFFQQEGIPFFWGDMGVDIEDIPPWTYNATGLYRHSATWSYIEQIWRNIYLTVYRSNVALNRVGQMDKALFSDIRFNDEIKNEKDVILGEAYFIRGMMYFYAVMIYGNVPLILEETTTLNTFPSQATPQTMYEQVISDLKMAESLLPWRRLAGEGGHATKGAAKSMLAKAYLQMTGFPLFQTANFSLAASKFKEVIDSNVYGLLDTYPDIFNPNNEDNKEIIFSVQYMAVEEGSSTGSYQGISGAVSKGAGYENTYVNKDFATSYDSSDVRFWWNISRRAITGKLTQNGFWYPWKFHSSPESDNSLKGFNWPVLRYSDVLLMYAEALNGANPSPTPEAYWAINQVRRRARLDQADADVSTSWLKALIEERLTNHQTTDNDLPDLSNLSKEDFLTALLKEQAWELCWEAQRKAMLIRTGKLKEYITEPHYKMQNYSYYPGLYFDESRDLWWPIPQRELDINPNLKQNPNY